MTLMPSLSMLQYLLLPGSFVLGNFVGILLPRSLMVQRHARLIFWTTLIAEILLFKIAYLIGGDHWTRITFYFAMGYLAFALKLLR